MYRTPLERSSGVGIEYSVSSDLNIPQQIVPLEGCLRSIIRVQIAGSSLSSTLINPHSVEAPCSHTSPLFASLPPATAFPTLTTSSLLSQLQQLWEKAPRIKCFNWTRDLVGWVLILFMINQRIFVEIYSAKVTSPMMMLAKQCATGVKTWKRNLLRELILQAGILEEHKRQSRRNELA